MAVLALVVCALLLTLAYPLRQFVAQRSRISALRDATVSQQNRVELLAAQQQRWQDPAYVRAQARERLHYVLPGETQYVVLEPDEAPAPLGRRRPRSTAAPSPAPGTQPWYGELWRSVEGAATPAPRAETPAVPGKSSRPE